MTDGNLHKRFLEEAIRLANINNDILEGGPFGAVIVKDGEIIARCHNTVVRDTDPTAHAEINALREAAKVLGTYNLSGCILYSSCEPCPMCLSALWWSRIDACYYAASREDAATASFDDQIFYHELERPAEERNVPVIQMDIPTSKMPFEVWIRLKHDIRY